MPEIIVMRHAKSIDRMEAEDDFERTLTERGRSDAARAGEAMKAAGLTATHALVSPSRRTRETWSIIKDVLGGPPVTDPMALYHASTAMLERATLELLAKGAERVVLVGHNPGIGGFAHALAANAGTAPHLLYGWPTSAAAAFTLETGPGWLRAKALTMLFNPKA